MVDQAIHAPGQFGGAVGQPVWQRLRFRGVRNLCRTWRPLFRGINSNHLPLGVERNDRGCDRAVNDPLSMELAGEGRNLYGKRKEISYDVIPRARCVRKVDAASG